MKSVFQIFGSESGWASAVIYRSTKRKIISSSQKQVSSFVSKLQQLNFKNIAHN